jgi:hypothetical protein
MYGFFSAYVISIAFINSLLIACLICRSRQVGQSYITSFFTTIWAILFSFKLVWSYQPDIILANGPGTCLPICFSAFLLKVVFPEPIVDYVSDV